MWRNVNNMESLSITERGKDLWEILCNSEQRTIINFLWNRFIRATDEGNVNYNNEERIKKMVKSETSKLNELIEEKDRKISTSDIKLVAMQEQIDEMRENKMVDIENAKKEYKEGQSSYINCLEGQVKTYMSRETELMKDKTNNESQINKLTSALMDKACGSSYDKGVEGEDNLLEILQESGEFIVEDTHTDNHKGDAVIRRNNKTYCIDSKNHKRNVPSEDVSKLVHDIELNNYDGGAIIAWNAPIYDPVAKAKIKNQICYKMISSKPILFVSHAKDISSEALISLLINIEDHIISDKTLETSENYNKLKEKMIKIASGELKKVESVHNSLQRQLGNNKKERHYWREVLKDCNKEVESSNESSINDLIKEISTKSSEQRNSTKDIINYLIKYCKNHNHPLLNQCESLKKDILNDILLKLNFIKGNIRGKNYMGNIRDKKSPSWEICLPNISDNDPIN